MPDIRRYIPVGYPRVVMFTRGDGTAELAELLATSHSARVDSDVVTSCVNHRADLVVTGSRHPSDLVASATGIDFDPAGVRRHLPGGGLRHPVHVGQRVCAADELADDGPGAQRPEPE